MAKLVFNFLSKIEELNEKIEEDAENILDVINIDAFLKDHLQEITKAEIEGKKFANQILKQS